MWAKLSVVVTPPGGGPSIARAGHTLSILNKQNGKWVLARDGTCYPRCQTLGPDREQGSDKDAAFHPLYSLTDPYFLNILL
jgi:hypothetical protein